MQACLRRVVRRGLVLNNMLLAALGLEEGGASPRFSAYFTIGFTCLSSRPKYLAKGLQHPGQHAGKALAASDTSEFQRQHAPYEDLNETQ